MHLTIVLPANVSFSSSVRVGVDEKGADATEVGWKRRLPGRCVAEAEAPLEVVHSCRTKTAPGHIRYAVASGQAPTLAFSFRGLGVALENLAKTTAAQTPQ
jgi:invasion protein IalB